MLESLNQQIALKLAEAADLLEQQGANPFRISAYRRASETVSRLQQDIGELAEARGAAGLIELPNIGKGIAGAIQELIATGHWSQLERLRGTLDPVRLFQTVPGIGPKMAEKIEQVLHVDTLEDLEVAACDGRLQNVPGLGARRIAGIRSALGAQLDKTRSRLHSQPGEGPAVKTLLEVDREYRLKVQQGGLQMIAPRRFNPEGKAWLPVLHTDRDNWHFTVLYSNTARAHELQRTDDWVVLYFYDDDHQEGQCTVVTESRGPLVGERVVRGRELECREYYRGSEIPH
jgi:putative hydrolase